MTEPSDAVVTLHELTKHGGDGRRREQLVAFRPMDPTNRPAPFKRYRGLPARPLLLEDDVVARLLFFSAGVTRRAGELRFRAAMSAGNLHPLEVYVVDAAGVHHFDPDDFAVTALRQGDYRGTLDAGDRQAAIVVTGVPWRTAWKYGERGFRHLYWDAGTMLANLLAVAAAHGVTAELRIGFVDGDVARLVGVDGAAEFPLVVVDIDRAAEPAAAPPPVTPLDLDVEPLSRSPIPFPLLLAAQRAGDLTDAAAVDAWRRPPVATPDPGTPLPGGADAEAVILQRGSTRIFSHDPLPATTFMEAMTWATRPAPADAASGLVHDVVVHAVEGIPAGAYQWDQDGLVQGAAGDFRATTQALCLGQPLGGDAAFTVFHAAPLGGGRDYRAAQLEAGIVSGRLALAAFARGAGATGLTFLDDPVSEFFATTDACLLVTAVGVPAYRNRAGGGPGAPTELTEFDRLMARMAQRF